MVKIVHIIFLLLWSGACLALENIYSFDQPEKKVRFEHIIQSYRCVVCENQTLAESEATLARDLRATVYEKIKSGETDEAVDLYLKNRFGHFIQYKPEFKWDTALLWLGPFLFLILGVFFVWKRTRH